MNAKYQFLFIFALALFFLTDLFFSLAWTLSIYVCHPSSEL